MKNWIPFDKAKKIAEVIGDADLCFVGGVVRESIMGEQTDDFDLVTKVRPDQVRDRLKHCGAKTYEIGIKYGTINCIFQGVPFEITTLRADIKTDGRFAEVEFCESIELDANRRDFTFNALYMDLTGHIYDFHNGVADLKNKRICFIGDASIRITEDYLRILRFFRFYGYYHGMTYREDELRAIIELKSGLAKLSAERKKKELYRIFTSRAAKPALSLASESGVLAALFGGQLDWNGNLCQNSVGNLLLLSGRYYEINQLAKTFAFTREELKLAEVLAKVKLDSEIDHCRLFYQHGEELYKIAVSYFAAKHNKPIQMVKPLAVEFPIQSSDLINLGFSGHSLGEKIKELEEQWLESKFKLSKQELLTIK